MAPEQLVSWSCADPRHARLLADAEETAATLRPGRFPGEMVLHTGDLFRQDEDGYFYFVARGDDIIKSKGRKSQPARSRERALPPRRASPRPPSSACPTRFFGQAVKACRRPARAMPAVGARRAAALCGVPRGLHGAGRRRVPCGRCPKSDNGKILKSSVCEEVALIANRGRQRPASDEEPGCLWFRSAALSKDRCGSTRPRPIESADGSSRPCVRMRKRGAGRRVLRRDRQQRRRLRWRFGRLGRHNVFGLMMPEEDSSPETDNLGRLIIEHLGVRDSYENITPDPRRLRLLPAARRGHRAGHSGVSVGLEAQDRAAAGDRHRHVPRLLDRRPVAGRTRRLRLGCRSTSYLQIVAATNFKQRTRKTLEYFHADRLNYAVAGTPNLLEYDQGFFVKLGDGAADLKPIAHLYKTQVYPTGRVSSVYRTTSAAGSRRPIPTRCRSRRRSSTFRCRTSRWTSACTRSNHGIPATDVAPAPRALTAEQVERVYRDIDGKRRFADYLAHGAASAAGDAGTVGDRGPNAVKDP